MGKMKPYIGGAIKEHGGEPVFMGLASKMYEVAGQEQQPNMAILKFPSAEVANQVAKGMPDRAGFVQRDMRVIEGKADMFQKNKSYLIVTVEQVMDEEKTKKYFMGFKEQNGKGYNTTYADGSVKPVSIAIKSMGPSTFYDDTAVGSGKVMPGPVAIKDDVGITTIAEFPDLESGLKMLESEDFKKTVFAALGEEYSADKDYAAIEKRFCAEVIRRGIRVVEMLEVPKAY